MGGLSSDLADSIREVEASGISDPQVRPPPTDPRHDPVVETTGDFRTRAVLFCLLFICSILRF